jgi:hypothetical protein
MQNKDKRKIFKYFNGKKEVYGDPFVINMNFFRALDSENVESLFEKMDNKDIQGSEYEDTVLRILPGIKAGFGVSEVDPDTGEGLTVDEMVELFGDFLVWRADLKKNTETSPNGAAPSQELPDIGSTTSSDGTGSPDSDPSVTMDSGSTVAVSA